MTNLACAFETHLNELKMCRGYSSILLDDGSTGFAERMLEYLTLLAKMSYVSG